MKEPVRFSESLAAFGTAEFEDKLASEIRRHASQLPLSHFCQGPGQPDFDGADSVRIEEHADAGDAIHVTALVYLLELQGGAGMDDDSTPVDGKLRLTIDKATGQVECTPESLD